jgi:hypothetical protein
MNPKEIKLTISDSIVEQVVQKIASRSNVGIKKYNTTLDRTDLSTIDWIDHVVEEQMDSILYLTRLKKDLEGSYVANKPIESNPKFKYTTV